MCEYIGKGPCKNIGNCENYDTTDLITDNQPLDSDGKSQADIMEEAKQERDRLYREAIFKEIWEGA